MDTMTEDQLAQYLAVPLDVQAAERQAGRLSGTKRHGTWRYSRRQVEAWVRRLRQANPSLAHRIETLHYRIG